MEEEERPELVAVWKAEGRCFRWTVAFTAGLCLWALGCWGAIFWFNHHFRPSLAKSGPITADQMGPFFLVNAIFSILFYVFSFGLIISLINWLLAIRKRRKMQMKIGFHPRENR